MLLLMLVAAASATAAHSDGRGRTLSSPAEQIKMVIAPNDLSPPVQIGPSRKPAPSADTAREPGVPAPPLCPLVSVY